MKKFLLVLGLIACVAMVSCNKSKQEAESKSAKADITATVEDMVGMDKQQMFTDYGKDYRWFETCIVLKDYLDVDSCDGTITGVSNVFQVVDEKDNGADVHVVMFTHVGDSTQVDVKAGFWVEDHPMNDEQIKITFKQAYDKLMQANCPKPHSRNCVLRKEVGPVACNPQYIFGNVEAQVYVDAITGDVKTKNPAFPENLQMPLGEWP